MLNSRLLFSFVLTVSLLVLNACGAKAGLQGTAGAPGRDVSEQGSSSGGGGFVKDNSDVILHLAADGLADLILRSSSEIWVNLPQGYQQTLAKLVRAVRYDREVNVTRSGDTLMFNYGTDSKGQYIIALKPFFLAYSSYPYTYSSQELQGNILKDVRRRLIHEAAHHLGIKLGPGHNLDADMDKAADLFAQMVLDALETDMVICGGADSKLFGAPMSPLPTHVQIFRIYTLNRPSGIAVQTSWTDPSGRETFANLVDHVQPALLTGFTKHGFIVHNYSPVFNVAEAIFQTGRENNHLLLNSGYGEYEQLKPALPDSQGRVALEVLHPLTQAESLTLQLQPHGLSATFRYTKTSTTEVPMDCRAEQTALVLPDSAANNDYYNQWKAAADQSTEDEQKEEFKRNSDQFLNIQSNPNFPAIDKLLSDELAKRLGDRLQKMNTLEIRNHGQSSCNTSIDHVAKTFELRDGRLCGVGLSATSGGDPVKLYKLYLDPSDISAYDHYDKSVVCFRDGVRVAAEDLIALFPEQGKIFSPSTEPKCVQ